ncbi:hypothetical protein KP509_21G057900 [Ceratopteris richardii]|nr:hypothetical protein KP509_21G057900 [Ceratopteris richardii]
MLKLIQFGITLTNKRGELPMIGGQYCIWQFNMRDFDITTDMFVPSSIQLLQNSGIDFERNRRDGIDSGRLGSLLVKFKFISNPRIRYVCYQGDYDFAYLIKAVTGELMPSTLVEFMKLRKNMFGPIYDVRHTQLHHFHTVCGLQRFSDSLGIKRICGAAHQAGSDSLLTSSTYQRLKSLPIKPLRGKGLDKQVLKTFRQFFLE